jgi:hypothetical protein
VCGLVCCEWCGVVNRGPVGDTFCPGFDPWNNFFCQKMSSLNLRRSTNEYFAPAEGKGTSAYGDYEYGYRYTRTGGREDRFVGFVAGRHKMN